MGKVSVIIAAAGKSTRMNGINKQTAMLCGIPVIVRSMKIFEDIDEVEEIIVSSSDENEIERLASEYKITKFRGCAKGGETRQESVINALMMISKETTLIAVHDGARPLTDTDVIKRCIKDTEIFGGAVLGVPVKDTIKVVEDMLITDTPDRRKLYITQTPQIFKKKPYYEGVNFSKEHELDFTDDCQMTEAIGLKVCMTMSDYMNIKITTPEDLAIAEAILKMREKEQ